MSKITFGKRLFDFDSAPYQKIKERVFENMDERLIQNLESLPRTDSPIEEIFLFALWTEMRFGWHEHGELQFVEEAPIGGPWATLYCQRQVEIEPYRVDFVFYATTRDELVHRLVVECDGHNYHERTKEQAIKDRSRDRDLQSRGYMIFRFTGAELWRNPCKCANEVLDWAVEASFPRP